MLFRLGRAEACVGGLGALSRYALWLRASSQGGGASCSEQYPCTDAAPGSARHHFFITAIEKKNLAPDMIQRLLP